ncbi:hypothetical protein PM082_012132 [Marasmius tenuissimus]|nr:hypothetical protein PM082_012132 [Marasmius tenuissimus]
MKFFVVFTALMTAVAATVVLEADSVAESLEERSVELDGRACVRSNCRCVPGIGPGGNICGNESINRYCTNGHLFYCNGNTGATCDYGFSTSCQKCGKPSC